MYIYPDGQDSNPDIRKAIRVPPEDHIKVTREQFDVYEQMDTTFELCKICTSNQKSVRIEPCGHLLCRACLDKWIQESQGRETLCPFCREKVLATEAVIVDPFHKSRAPPPGQRLDRAQAAARASIFSVDEDDDDDDISDDDEVAADYENINLSSFLAGGAPSPAPARPPKESAPTLPPRTGNTLRRGQSGAPPLRPRQSSSSDAPGAPVDVDDATARLCALGFTEPKVRKALKIAKGDMKMAADILLQFAD